MTTSALFYTGGTIPVLIATNVSKKTAVLLALGYMHRWGKAPDFELHYLDEPPAFEPRALVSRYDHENLMFD